MSRVAIVRHLGLADYAHTLTRMQDFTNAREPETTDEIWVLEHPSVYTLGTNADETHIKSPGDTPIVQVDRGGQVTWHGPGQLVVYVLLDLGRVRLGVRELVCRLENAIIATLAGYGITAAGREGAPGVYVGAAKVASVGLRVRRNCCYHGIAVNVCNELDAFTGINPCGYEGLEVTRIADLGGPTDIDTVAGDLLAELLAVLELEQQN